MENIKEMLLKSSGSSSGSDSTAVPTWAAAVTDAAVLAALDTIPKEPVQGRNSTRLYVEGDAPEGYTLIDGKGGIRRLVNGTYLGKYYGNLLLNMNDGNKYAVPTFILGDGSLFSVACEIPKGTTRLKVFALSLEWDDKNGRMKCTKAVAA